LGLADKLITPHPLYNALAQVEEIWRAVCKKLFDGRVPEKVVEELNDGVEKDSVLGNEDFHVRIAKLTG
jgi:hypothetical protein